MKRRGEGSNFLHGALVLTIGMAAVKVIGALFKIPLSREIGEYGMGLFHAAYHFYGPVFSLATAGFPSAVSLISAECRTSGHAEELPAVRRAALTLYVPLGLIGTALLTLLAPWYCRFSAGENALLPLLALAPAVLFACIGAVYRGSFQGRRRMAPTAISEVIEALVKLVLGLALSHLAVTHGTAEYTRFGTIFSLTPPDDNAATLLILSFAAAGAVLGVTAGCAVSTLYLWLAQRLSREPKSSATKPVRKHLRRRLWRVTVPIALGSLATNAAGLIDAAFLQNTLARLSETHFTQLLTAFSGMTPDMVRQNPQALPTFLYGCYTMAMTLYLLVPALAQPIGISALPAVTEAYVSGNRKELTARCSSVCRVTALLCFPMGLGLSAVAAPAVRLLYGAESSSLVAGVLTILGVAALPTALTAPLGGMLQACGRADLPVKLLTAAMTLKLLCNRFLCANPQVHIYGAAVGTLLCYGFLAIAEFLFLRRLCGNRLSAGSLFAKPLLCASVCALTAFFAQHILSNFLPEEGALLLITLAVSVLLGGAVYVVLLVFTGAIEKNDLKMLPAGEKITKMLEKCRRM